MMRVLVCGGRNFSDRKLVREELAAREPTTVITGGAPGADRIAETWARDHAIHLEIYTADWTTFGAVAGPIRNQRMLDEAKPDLVLAFPDRHSRGTWDMVRKAEAAGVPVAKLGPWALPSEARAR